MIKKLTKHGNSLALVIDKGILDLLHIDAETPLSLDTDGRNLIISPANSSEREKRFGKALEKVNRKYAKAFKRLAE
jgi:antitoxin component of MazEF toxin-antitoxin module